jgi:type IV secretion system protein VirD4
MPRAEHERMSVRLSRPGLLIGARPDQLGARFGFAQRTTQRHPKDTKLVRWKGEAHALTVASTGAGKGTCTIIPNVCMWDGPLVVVDMKGEIASVTRRRREAMGDRTIVIDPFSVLGDSTDSLNPLDIMRLPGAHVEDAAESVAWSMSSGHETAKDPFWQHTATALVAGIAAHVSTLADPAARTLGSLVDILNDDDVVYRLAVMLDTKVVKNEFARRRIAEFLQIPDSSGGATRACVLASAKQYLHTFEAERVRRSIGPSSFDINDIVKGDVPLAVYFVFPPSKVHSHRGLLRMWLTTITEALTAREAMPERPTLVMLDETAQLGRIEQLAPMHSYLRGSGVTLWTIWQSLGQLETAYPKDWRVIVENCGVVQAFGLHSTAVGAVANLLGVSPETLRRMRPNEQIVTRGLEPPEVLSRVDYRTHRLFRGLYDANPRYAHRSGSPAH